VICCILILYSDDLLHWVAPGRTAYSFSLHENKLHFIKTTFGPILLSLLDYRSSVMAASLVFRTMNAKIISSCIYIPKGDEDHTISIGIPHCLFKRLLDKPYNYVKVMNHRQLKQSLSSVLVSGEASPPKCAKRPANSDTASH